MHGDSYRQHVPRPPLIVAGEPPPWAGRPQRPPGLDLVSSVIADARRAPLAEGDPASAVGAAVLLALYDAPGGATAVLIRRSAQLLSDPGHVALPGGKIEPGETPLDAALRESEEEIGLDRESVEVLGELGRFERPLADERIACFVGALGRRPALRANPDEVEAVVEVPLASLLAEGVAWRERWGPDGRHEVCFFAHAAELGEDLVWGLTARILWHLLAELVAAPSPPRPAAPR